MRKEFRFIVKNHKIKITNSWLWGAKLYIDGDLRDKDSTLLANGKTTLLSVNLGEHGILEVMPTSAIISVEMDAFLIVDNHKQHVYSSHKDITLTEPHSII